MNLTDHDHVMLRIKCFEAVGLLCTRADVGQDKLFDKAELLWTFAIKELPLNTRQAIQQNSTAPLVSKQETRNK